MYQKDPANEATRVKSKVILSHLLSPERTGVLDELLALHRFGVLTLKKGGVPKAAKAWYSSIDLMLLNEMYECWSPQADPSGKFMVSNKLRRKLHDKWMPSEQGWSLKDEPTEIIFEYDEWEEWRNSFESKQEEKTNTEHGIGGFGL